MSVWRSLIDDDEEPTEPGSYLTVTRGQIAVHYWARPGYFSLFTTHWMPLPKLPPGVKPGVAVRRPNG